MDFDIYCHMLTYDGYTPRERAITKLHRDITYLAPMNPSYKEVTINGEPRHLIVNSTLDTTVKDIVAMPGENLCVGNHVRYCDHDYWVTDASVNDGIYAYGKMTVCTDVVRFISPYDGSIVEYPTILTNSTKFNTGETPNKRLTLPSGQFTMLLPINKHTILIDNGARFLLDKRLDYPSAYRVTSVDASTYGYDDGLLNIVLLQCALDKDKDNIELMIADYYKKETEEPPSSDAAISFDYDNPVIRIGGTGTTFSPTLTGDVQLPLQFTVSTTEEVYPYLDYMTTDTSITFKVGNNMALIGSYVNLTISDCMGDHAIKVLLKLKGLI